MKKLFQILIVSIILTLFVLQTHSQRITKIVSYGENSIHYREYLNCVLAEVLLEEYGDSIFCDFLEVCNNGHGSIFRIANDTIIFSERNMEILYSVYPKNIKEKLRNNFKEKNILGKIDITYENLIIARQCDWNKDLINKEINIALAFDYMKAILWSYEYYDENRSISKLDYIKQRIKEVKEYKYRTLSEWVDSIRLSKILKQHPLLI